MIVLDEPAAPAVRERWSRALSLGARADGDAYPEGTSGADLTLRRERLRDAFREERARLAPVTGTLAGRGVVAIVADTDGVILASDGQGALGSPAARVRLVEGATWSERARGTNAIGTALAESRPVAVIGAAHFEARNKGLFCYATPVRDGYGDVVCVLDVTGDLASHAPSSGAAVRAAGRSLERVLRTLAFAQAGIGALGAVERLVERCSVPSLLVEASGAVGVANDLARRAFGGALDCERLFGVGFRELADLALTGARTLGYETQTMRFDVELEPILGASGRPLAVLVNLTEKQARVLVAPPAKKTEADAHPAFAAVLAEDATVLRAKASAARFASTELPVLLLAETGTGKELFARAIHEASPRRARPFVALNCGALAPALLESELFGYAPGAFTGALRGGTEGRIAAADGGTLFLDEIAEMPPALQAALLRVLDDGVYQRVGEATPRRADFRLVCATCRDLPAMVDSGAFRKDLFYRIHGALVTIPPLRDRTDRAWLAAELLRRIEGAGPFGDSARAHVETHDWPGNVRELKTAVIHAAALAAGRAVEAEDFPALLVGQTRVSQKTRDAQMRELVRSTVAACGGNLSEAARRLGIARTTVYRALRD